MEKRTRDFLLLFLGSLVLFCVFFNNSADYDMWGYLGFGKAFWGKHGFLRHDIFSYMPVNNSWVFHEWLSGVLLYPIYKSFGGQGLQIWRYALVLATCLFIFRAARQRGGSPFACFICLMAGAFLFRPGLNPLRAHIFTYLFLAITLYVLEKYSRNRSRRTIAVLVPLFLLWANLHGGFIAGLGIFFLYVPGSIIDRQDWRFPALVLGACFLSALINPYGPYLYKAIILHTLYPETNIVEWDSVYGSLKAGRDVFGLGFFLLLFFVFIVLLIKGKIRGTGPKLILFAGFFLGFSHIRHIPLLAVFFAVYIPEAISGYFKKPFSYKPDFILIMVFCFLSITISLFAFSQNIYKMAHPNVFGGPFALDVSDAKWDKTLKPVNYPMEAIDFMVQNNLYKGRILSQYEWGSFISFMLFPHARVALDGRCETIYPESTRQGYFDFYYGRKKTFDYIKESCPDLILMRPETGGARALEKNPLWKKVWQNKGSVIYLPENHRLPKIS